jgi:sterol 3beta-glucosyltransferase
MRIAIYTLGSHGDVHPYVAMGRGLQEAGFDVRVVTHGRYADFVRDRGLDVFPLKSDPVRDLDVPIEGMDIAVHGTLHGMARALAYANASWTKMSTGDGLDGFDGVDAIVFSWPAFHGLYIAEKLGIPAVGAFLSPLLERPTLGPHLGFVKRSAKRAIYWTIHRLFERDFWRVYGPVANAYRQGVLGLRPLGRLHAPRANLRRRRLPIMYGVSPKIFPASVRVDEWCRVTGYWLHDDPVEWEIPADLREFLASGEPPIFISFGSMVFVDVDNMRTVVLGALEQTGQRAIVQPGWGGLTFDGNEKRVFCVHWAPYEKLFPHVSMMVNHGGQGTVAAVLKGGIPQIVVPFTVEHRMWGQRLRDLGIGVCTVDNFRLTTAALSEAIAEVIGDRGMREDARELGEALRQEDGVAEAVRFLCEYLGSRG